MNNKPHTDIHSRSPRMAARLCGVYMLTALILTACSSRYERSEFYAIDADGWIYGDTLQYLPCGTDSTGVRTVDMAVVVRHTNEYAYANLWLQMIYHNGDTIVTDTLNIPVADKFGNWLGKGIGVSYQIIDTVRHNTRIDTDRPVKVTHIMRQDTLPYIEQVGLVIVDRTPQKTE